MNTKYNLEYWDGLQKLCTILYNASIHQCRKAANQFKYQNGQLVPIRTTRLQDSGTLLKNKPSNP